MDLSLRAGWFGLVYSTITWGPTAIPTPVNEISYGVELLVGDFTELSNGKGEDYLVEGGGVVVKSKSITHPHPN